MHASDALVSHHRNRKSGTMVVDDSPAVTGSVPGRFVGLDLGTPLYVGGVPSSVNAAKDTYIDNGFVGEMLRTCKHIALSTSHTLAGVATVDMTSQCLPKVASAVCW